MKKRIIIYILLVLILTGYNFYFRPVEGNKLITNNYKNSDAYINNLYMSDEYFKKKLVPKKYYSVYKDMMTASENNETEVTLDCDQTCGNMITTISDAIYLDHPELMNYTLWYGGHNKGDKYTYKASNTISKLNNKLGALRIERELDIIKNETKNMDEKEKIIYVYNYVASHNYDRIFTYSKDNQSIYSFFNGSETVCAAFAKSSQIIFQNIGIKSYLVMGNDHMWNYVQYNNKYYIFDATVGTSFVDKKSKYYYDGLGKTTVNVKTGNYQELYPKIEDQKLKDIFNIK